MAISSRSRSKRFSGSISMEIVTEVRDEWQNQEGSSERTRRDCREDIVLVME